MNAVVGLIARIMFNDEIKEVIERKVSPEWISDETLKKCFEFILNFYTSYGQIPSIELVEEQTGMRLEYAKEPVGFYIDKLIDEFIRQEGSKALISRARDMMVSPRDGVRKLQQDLASLVLETVQATDVNWVDTVNERKEWYIDRKNAKGVDGFPTPWDALNMVTMGLHSGEFVVCVARTTVGKTWFLTLLADFLHSNGVRVLFVSNEMPVSQVARRLDAVRFKLPYEDFRYGLLPDHHEKRYFEGLDELKGEPAFWIVSDISGVMSIDLKIEEYNPDVVIVDGLYLLADDRGDESRWERTANISRDLKKLATKQRSWSSDGVVVVASSQLNRSTSELKPETVTLKNLSFADNIGQDADTVIGLFRTPKMIARDVMLVRILKCREGEPKNFVIKWDFKTMTFDQVDDAQDQVYETYDEDEPLDF